MPGCARQTVERAVVVGRAQPVADPGRAPQLGERALVGDRARCGRSPRGCRAPRPRPAGGWRAGRSCPRRRARRISSAHVAHARRVEPGRGLVEQQQLRVCAAAPRRSPAAGACRASSRRPCPWRGRVSSTISRTSSIRSAASPPSSAAQQLEVAAAAEVGVEARRLDEARHALERRDARPAGRARTAAPSPRSGGSGRASSAATSSCRPRSGRGSRRRRRRSTVRSTPSTATISP